MKKFVNKASLAASVIMGAGIIGAALAGIAPASAFAADNEVTIPEPGISSLDPTQWGAQILIDQGTVLEGLYGYNSDNQLEPKIASGYKISDGGRVWTIYLRHNAKWSNGQPVTAQDFYYAWMRLASPADSTGALWAGVMSNVVNAWAYHAGAASANMVGLKVVNPYALQITLGEPQDILGQLAITGSMPLYPPAVEAHPNNWYLPQYFVGDGPYVVKSFVPNGEVQLTRNPNYVGNSKEVNVGNVSQINIIPAPTVPLEDYLANKLSVALIGNPSDYQYIKSHANLEAQVHIQPQYNVTFLEYDKSTTASPIDNPLVREAVAMAIDRAPIANNVLNGMAEPAYAFGPASLGPVKYEHALPYNVAAARALLAKAGYPNGKGIGELQLYCQTVANSPASVAVAEAIQEELKQALNLNFKIDPTAATLWGDITWGGLNPGVEPGFNIGQGVINWNAATNLTMQANQFVGDAGTMGPASYREHVSNWYFPTYDPAGIAEYGNPNDPSAGTSWTDMLKIQASVIKDNAYLTAWFNKQPALYRELNAPQPGNTTMDLWTNLVNEWKAATTPAAKHAVWVNAWKFVSNYSAGNGGTNVGLDGQVYQDEHETKAQYEATIWGNELNGATTAQQENTLASKIDNLLMSQGYVTPLVLNESIFLEKPNVVGTVTNPWSWNNIYQLQYINVK